MTPRDRHFTRGVRDALAAKLGRQVFYQTALVVVVQPVLQIMQTREIFPGADPAAVPIDFDVMKEIFRRPIFLWLVQHPRKRQ